MKRTLLVALLIIFACSAITAQPKKKKKAGKKACPTSLAKCHDKGCGGDPLLNGRKNIRSDSQAPTVRTLQWMKDLPDPQHFTRQSKNRAELTALGEGQMIKVVAYALVARKGSKESCNCGLSAPKDTDNHIVLVDSLLQSPTLEADEDDSETAEFTPRVRLQHPNLARAKLQPLIDAQGGKLLVRVTGLLMFDSEHFLGRHLHRHNNWEIHPVMGLEYCPQGKICTESSDANWKSLE